MTNIYFYTYEKGYNNDIIRLEKLNSRGKYERYKNR